MKIGVIIVFYNNELDISRNLFDGLSNVKNHLHLCLINNGSEDATLDRLEALKEISKLNTVVVDIKQNRGVNNAIKAGARYLFNQNKLKYIGYVSVDKLKTIQDLDTLLNTIEIHKESIIQLNSITNKNTQIKRMIFKNVFCILECINTLDIKLNTTDFIKGNTLI
ncbi:MAG: glycosyltransferase [Algibacter sp.]